MASILAIKDQIFVQNNIEETLSAGANQRELTEEEIWALLTPEQQANALRKRAEAENKTS